jgi:hypothetical protein
MADQPFNDFIPPDMRKFADQSVQQAKKAFDDLMNATKSAVSTFEGHASSAQATALELQRKVVGYSERNVSTSLEFAQNLLRAKSSRRRNEAPRRLREGADAGAHRTGPRYRAARGQGSDTPRQSLTVSRLRHKGAAARHS